MLSADELQRSDESLPRLLAPSEETDAAKADAGGEGEHEQPGCLKPRAKSAKASQPSSSRLAATTSRLKSSGFQLHTG